MNGTELPEEVTVDDISDNPTVRKLRLDTMFFADEFIKIYPYNQVFPKKITNYLQEIKGFNVHHSDIWISSFPKCGTTWTQEMVWCIQNNLDFKRAKETNLDKRVPFFEFSGITEIEVDNSFEMVGQMPSPRIIKTHLKLDMLPQQCIEKNAKIIYVTRNPRDACVSYYYHNKTLSGYSGSFEDFAEAFLEDVLRYTPFVPHVLSYWEQREKANILFITYENMKRNLPGVIKQVAEFLGKELTDQDMGVLAEHLSFKKMKDNSSVNKQELVERCNKKMANDLNSHVSKGRFMRKGQVGDWKEHMDGDMLKKFQKWEENSLKGSDLRFVYELQ